MKRFKIFVITLVGILIFPTIVCLAQSVPGQLNNGNNGTILRPDPKQPNRPNNLTSNVIYCYYQNGEIVFLLDEYEISGYVHIFSSKFGMYGYVDENYNSLIVPFNNEIVNIIFYSDNGILYTGEISLIN